VVTQDFFLEPKLQRSLGCSYFVLLNFLLALHLKLSAT